MSIEILKVENPLQQKILTQASLEVNFPLSKEAQSAIQNLKEAISKVGGVGLAAPQIGVNLRIIAIKIDKIAAAIRKNAVPYPLTVFINPSYEPLPESYLFTDWEGCLSIQTVMAKVDRHFRIRFRAQDEQGAPLDTVVEGFLARVLQHEIDHTNGILFTERLHAGSLKGPPQEMTKLRRAELAEDLQSLFDSFIAGLQK